MPKYGLAELLAQAVIKGTDLFGPVSFCLVAKITLTVVFHLQRAQVKMQR